MNHAQIRADHHRSLIAEALAALDEPVTFTIAHLKPGLRRYLVDRIETGGFLRCVLENDLLGAASRADRWFTMAQMKTLMQLLQSGFPAIAWGSPETVAAWLAEGHAPLVAPDYNPLEPGSGLKGL